MIALKDERTSHVNRLKGLLANHGLELRSVDAHFPESLDTMRCWDGSTLSDDLRARLLREALALRAFDGWQASGTHRRGPGAEALHHGGRIELLGHAPTLPVVSGGSLTRSSGAGAAI